jgi:hypothetical protein
VQSAHAEAFTEQGGWSGGGQYAASCGAGALPKLALPPKLASSSGAGNARQQRGISGEIHDRKSSSQEAAGAVMNDVAGLRAALATCARRQ